MRNGYSANVRRRLVGLRHGLIDQTVRVNHSCGELRNKAWLDSMPKFRLPRGPSFCSLYHNVGPMALNFVFGPVSAIAASSKFVLIS